MELLEGHAQKVTTFRQPHFCHWAAARCCQLLAPSSELRRMKTKPAAREDRKNQ